MTKKSTIICAIACVVALFGSILMLFIGKTDESIICALWAILMAIMTKD